MRKSLIALILLFGLLGCNTNHSPVTVQNEADTRRTTDSVDNPTVVDTETTTEHLSAVFGRSSFGTIEEVPPPSTEIPKIELPKAPEKLEQVEKPKEPERPKEIEKAEESVEAEKPEQPVETVSSTPIQYTSRKDGFRVLLPSTPKVMNLDVANNTHVRIYQTQVRNGMIVYNIFFHYFETKKVSDESIQSYLDSPLPDRLTGVDKGQLIQKTSTQFRGFKAKEAEYVSVAGDMEFIYRAIVFVIDGDSISLTMAYPEGTQPEWTFDEFSSSFELLPLEPVLSPNVWIDEPLGLRFTPPADMAVLNKERKRNGLIVTFANEVGHTLGILDATIAYRGITWSDIQQKLSEMKDCGDGFYENVITATTTKTPTVQLLRCVRNDERIYLLQAYAPKKTYFRYVETFKAAMKTFSFSR